MKAEAEAQISSTIRMAITEVEARGLAAIARFGPEQILHRFNLHRFNLSDQDKKGISSFFDAIDEIFPEELQRIDQARAAFDVRAGKVQ